MTYRMGQPLTTEQEHEGERQQGRAEAAYYMHAADRFDALLEQAIARVEIANREGDPILSAWLNDARESRRAYEQGR